MKSKNENDWQIFKSARNSYNKLIKWSIRHHYSVEIRDNQGNTKNMWKTINNLIHKSKKSQNITEIRNENGEMVDISGIPNAFNNHFTDLGFILSQTSQVALFHQRVISVNQRRNLFSVK